MSNTLLNKNQAGNGIWTADNLVAGNNINISLVNQPIIDSNTLGVWHLENNINNAVEGSSVAISSGSYSFAKTFSNSFSKFGDYCAKSYCDSGSGSSIFTGVDLTAINNITFDCWMRTPTTNPGVFPSIFCLYQSSNPMICVQSRYDSILIKEYSSSSSNIASISVDGGSWHHVAIEYISTILNIYIDGIKKYSDTHQIGNRSLRYFQGTLGQTYYDEIRLSNIARYNGQNFTPFTEPYSSTVQPEKYAINNTQQLPDVTGMLKNTSGATNSLTINGVATVGTQCINIGDNSQAVGGQSIAIGAGTTTSNAAYSNTNSVAIGFASRASYSSGTAIGRETETTGNNGVAVGYESVATTNAVAIGKTAKATAQSAIQIGTGTNSTASTVQINGTQILNASGKVPTSSIDFASISGYDATKTQVLKNVQGTLTWVDEA